MLLIVIDKIYKNDELCILTVILIILISLIILLLSKIKIPKIFSKLLKCFALNKADRANNLNTKYSYLFTCYNQNQKRQTLTIIYVAQTSVKFFYIF